MSEANSHKTLPILEVADLWKSYDGSYQAVRQCNFQLPAGRIAALVGDSGSGKSTLLRLIAGLERPDRGQITISGQVVSSDQQIIPPQQRPLGMVFQDYALFPHLTVGENIAFGLKGKQPQRVAELLRLVQLEGFEQRYPAELSGGQEQRVALARSLALKPKLLLLDEPFSNLDANLKANLRRAIADITRTLSTSLLFITHDLLDALDIADDLLYLHQGELCYYGPVTAINDKSDPRLQDRIQELRENAHKVLRLTSKGGKQL